MADKVRTGKTGFALLDPAKLKGLARRGGQTSQRSGKGHAFTPEEARGRQERRPFSQSRPSAHGKDWPPRCGESAEATSEGEKP
jgi:hypothetical protein